MRTRLSLEFALVAGFGLGAATIHGLQAQAKPPVFSVTELEISNLDAYMKEFAPKAQALSQKYGSRLLANSTNVVAIEGPAPKRAVVQQWESMEKVKAWHTSSEYKDARKIGDKYAKFRVYAVEGRPQP